MAPRETENNAYAKFWGDKERALWYVMVFSGVVNSRAPFSFPLSKVLYNEIGKLDMGKTHNSVFSVFHVNMWSLFFRPNVNPRLTYSPPTVP